MQFETVENMQSEASEKPRHSMRNAERSPQDTSPQVHRPQFQPAATEPTKAQLGAVLGLQRSAGNQAVSSLLQREQKAEGADARATDRLVHDPPHAVQQVTGQAVTIQRARGPKPFPKIVTVSGEKVRVASLQEHKEARSIVVGIQRRHGIKLNSKAGIAAITNQYTSVPVGELGKLRTRPWTLPMLRAVKAALLHYAPILGKKRKKSSRQADPQEVTTISYLEQAIDEDTPSGALDTDTLGEYFKGSTNFSLFGASETAKGVFGDAELEAQGTAVHEMAHGLMKHRLTDFINGSNGYWLNRNTRSGAIGAEAPPTGYGNTNADEDLSESVMLYFTKRARLQNGLPGVAHGSPGNACPIRDKLIDEWVKNW